jgi:hypothetical protein
MKLMCELCEDYEVITEEKAGKKHLYISGPFIQTETKNRNGRVYPKGIMEREVDRYTHQYVNENRAYGELGHPSGPTVNPERISHRIVELKWSGNDVHGKAMIQNTPYGNIVENIIADGGKMAVSTRGIGSLKQEGNQLVVQQDFFLATAADIVTDPSAQNAFVEGIMEGVDWIMENGVWKHEQIDAARKLIDDSNRSEREATKLKVFEHFVSRF